MTPSTLQDLEPLFQLVGRQAPGLLPVCRWLALEPGAAAWFLDRDGREPERQDLIRLLGIFEPEDPRARALGRSLVARSEHAAEALVAFGLERLIEAGEGEWAHPSQILALPCPDFGDLLDACKTRLKGSKGEARRRLQSVRAKLERAARLAETARRRRAEAGRREAEPGTEP